MVSYCVAGASLGKDDRLHTQTLWSGFDLSFYPSQGFDLGTERKQGASVTED